MYKSGKNKGERAHTSMEILDFRVVKTVSFYPEKRVWFKKKIYLRKSSSHQVRSLSTVSTHNFLLLATVKKECTYCSLPLCTSMTGSQN
jgi:hypothetical protein